MKEVKSSHVVGHAYDPAKKKLTVKFKDGSMYDYDHVMQSEYDALDRAPSTGKHLFEHVFPFKRGTKRL